MKISLGPQSREKVSDREISPLGLFVDDDDEKKKMASSCGGSFCHQTATLRCDNVISPARSAEISLDAASRQVHNLLHLSQRPSLEISFRVARRSLAPVYGAGL